MEFSLERQSRSIVMHLTSHFMTRWKERMGGNAPSLEDANRMLNESVKIRNQVALFRKAATGFEPYILLAEYLNPRLGVLFKVDENNGRLVTLIVIPKRERGSI